MSEINKHYLLSADDEEFRARLNAALDDAVRITKRNIAKFADGDVYPTTTYRGGCYGVIKNGGEGSDMWTESFWSGRLWLCYEETGDGEFRKLAEKNLDDFFVRLDKNINIDWHHDIGFLYTLSAVAPYRLTGNEFAKKTALTAAYLLSRRFRFKGEFIQSMADSIFPEYYRLIADTMMNIPLLFWASEVSGERKYRDYAVMHMNTAIKYILRENGGVYHHFLMDNKTGAPLHGLTLQGASDESYWSRAQAWVIYGLAVAYSYTHDESIIEPFFRAADFYVSHLPSDCIPYWDFIFTEGDEPRDSSAAAIAICGFMEMARHLPHDEKMQKYISVAKNTLLTLTGSEYAISFDSGEEGLLAHTTHDKPRDNFDLCTTYGDYYYMESLVRALRDWKMYW